MVFNENNYIVESLTLEGMTIEYRSFRNLVYVDKPVDKTYQSMNIFAPEVYFLGGKINGYDLSTAPVFMPNTVGGYMPGLPDEPGYSKMGDKPVNAIFHALARGYVVAAPGARGRVLKDEQGNYYGKAPACIVDLKAAVRYLHFFHDKIPGDTSKIITNGTSAGGALSALLGATGNSVDYELYLEELGAAKAGDDIFAASCYCPITNLEHADMAYEWQFDGVYDFHRKRLMSRDEGGRPTFAAVDGVMSDGQIQISKEEAKLFPQYINSLSLKGKTGDILGLDESGEGSFKEYIKSLILESAQTALYSGLDLNDKKWLTVKNGIAVEMDFQGYVKDTTRMKEAPAFDDVHMNSPENDLFGTRTENFMHFTEYSYNNSLCGGNKASADVVKMLNPMYYIGQEGCNTAKYWRIRHGEIDRDTSLAIPAILAVTLMNKGYNVDFMLPWNIPHSGDYDLEELFSWIDEICMN